MRHVSAPVDRCTGATHGEGMGIKGYWVRRTKENGRQVRDWRATLDEAAGFHGECLRGGAVKAEILAVAEDGTETPLPSYEAALAEIVKLTIERNEAHLTALASVDETAAVYERETRWHSMLAKERDVARAQAAHFRKLAASWGVPEEKLAEVDAIAAPPPHDLTPSEVALAKVLAAWDEWPDAELAPVPTIALCGIGQALLVTGWVDDNADPTADGQALLDRARKAGVL